MVGAVGGALPDWFDAHAFRDGELRLELLHPRHARAWIRYNRDGTIARLARQPILYSRQHASQWLQQHWLATHEAVDDRESQCFSFAIVHDHRGFLGCVRLERFQRSAFFSFWVGTPHQDRGFGTRAAQLTARALCRSLRIDDLFTAVYPDNPRSLRVLTRAGWGALPFSAAPPKQDLLFCHRALSEANPETQTARLARRLKFLLAGLGSDWVFADEPNR